MALQSLLLATVAAVVGLIIGVRRGGSPVNLAHADLQWWRLFFLAMGLIGLADVAPDFSLDLGLVVMGAVGLVVVGLALMMLFALRNLHLIGVSIVAVGLALNLLATVANDGFPVDKGALIAANIEDARTVDEAKLSGGQHLRTDDDRLWWLGNAIPFRELEQVLSFGDLIIIGGIGCSVEHLTRRKRLHPPPPLSPDARAGLVSIAAPEIRLDDPVIDLALVAEAAHHGYAARPIESSDAADSDAADPGAVGSEAAGHDEREPGPGLRDSSESMSGVGLPILGET
ncbi:MAG: DUF5317 family protein [Acidimicrobiales bacterium]